MHLFILIIYLVSCMSIWFVAVYSKPDWDFSFLRFECNTSNTEIADIDFRIIRSRSGTYALNGTLFLGADIDDTYWAALKVYQSQSGSSQYRETPFGIQKTSFYKFMTSIYIKLLQNQMSQCTNLPVHETEFNTPLTKKQYNLDMCVLSNENMPGHMQPGLYKVSVIFKRDNFELWMSGYFDVQAAVFSF